MSIIDILTDILRVDVRRKMEGRGAREVRNHTGFFTQKWIFANWLFNK